MPTGMAPPGLEATLKEALPGHDYEVSRSGGELVVTVPPRDLVGASRILKDDPRLAFDYLRCLSGVDWGDHLQVVYHLWSMGLRHRVEVKVDLAPEEPRLPSVTSVWRGADWHEREAAELFGIAFEGHPRLKPLLLFEGFEGYPLRKSYPQGGKARGPMAEAPARSAEEVGH